MTGEVSLHPLFGCKPVGFDKVLSYVSLAVFQGQP